MFQMLTDFTYFMSNVTPAFVIQVRNSVVELRRLHVRIELGVTPVWR